MKRIRIARLGSQLLAPRTRAASLYSPSPSIHRLLSTQASPSSSPPYPLRSSPPSSRSTPLEDLPSPLVSASLSSPKLAALHARLSLPQRFPLQTLARTLVDRTADPNDKFNNTSLATLGSDVMGYYMSEYLICHYPRLPMDVLFAAQEAYIGPKALLTISKEWGVESAAEPGGEVDPGLLQFRNAPPGINPFLPVDGTSATGTGRPNEAKAWRRGMSSRILYDDQFGALRKPQHDPASADLPQTTAEEASSHFVQALVGALQLHTGRAATRKFFSNHFLSRVLNLSALFDFRYPTRDLSRLCLREGFEPPVARLVSESGRHSAHPIFVVGVFSGRDKLGEAVGGNLDEARTRAATAALKGWYLYSPLEVCVPSETEDGGGEGRWRANMVDPGEIVT